MNNYSSKNSDQEPYDDVVFEEKYGEVTENLYQEVDEEPLYDKDTDIEESEQGYITSAVKKMDDYGLGTGIASTGGLATGLLATGTIEGMAVFGTWALLGYAGGRLSARKIRNYLDGDQ